MISIASALADVFEDVRLSGHIPESSLRILDHLLPNLAKALELLEKKQVTRYEAYPSGRQVYLSRGSERKSYLCSRRSCSCHSFNHDVMLRNNYIFCKHQVAVCLGEALGGLPTRILNDADMGLLIHSKYLLE